MEKDLKELLDKIRELREKMNKVVEDKESLLDKDVIDISRMMDKLLNQYEEICDGNEEILKNDKKFSKIGDKID